jgi:hypothetical protein
MAVTSSGAASSGTYSAAAAKPALETDAKASSEIRNETARESVATSANFYSESGLADGGSEIDQIKSALEKRRKMFLVTAIEGARKASVENNELCLEFAPDARHLRDSLAKSENVKILREVCKEISGRDLGVRFVITDSEANAAMASGAPVSKEETERREQQLDKQSLREKAEKDPTVQQMLRTFRGEIVDVKRANEKS